jgi:3-oxoacyl-[acyl-carrier-protein] synthase-3
MTSEDFRQGRHFPCINTDAVRRFGEESLPAVVREAVEEAELQLEDVDLYVLSHVFPDVAENAGGSLGLPSSRVLVCGGRHGHLSAASLPVALSEATLSGSVARGATVCLATSGAGFAWGAAVIRL